MWFPHGGKPERQERPNFCRWIGWAMKPIAGAALALGFILTCATAASAEWKGTIGEPLRNSTDEALRLAEHLRQIGARFYGSWSCPACFRQMNLFGKQGGLLIPYVECTKPGKLPEQAQLCRSEGIKAYPTWVLPDNRRREGVQSIEELSSWSGLR